MAWVVFSGLNIQKLQMHRAILVASHMDEVGFMVSEIKPDGTFRVVEIGGWNPMVVQQPTFQTLDS